MKVQSRISTRVEDKLCLRINLLGNTLLHAVGGDGDEDNEVVALEIGQVVVES